MVTQKSAKRRGARAEQIIGERFLSGRRAYREGIPGSTDLLNPYHLHVDVKSHASLSDKWYTWMYAAENVGANIAAVTCQESERLFFIFRAAAVDGLFTHDVQPVVHVIENARPPKTPIGWLDNMIEHCENGMAPCVALHRKGSPYERTVILMDFKTFDFWTRNLGGEKDTMSDKSNEELIDDLRAQISGMINEQRIDDVSEKIEAFTRDKRTKQEQLEAAFSPVKTSDETIDQIVQRYYEAFDRVNAAKLEMAQRKAVFDDETRTLKETIDRWSASMTAAKAEADYRALMHGEKIEGLNVEDHVEADGIETEAFLRWAVANKKYGILKIDLTAAESYVRHTSRTPALQDGAWDSCPAEAVDVKKTKWTAKLRKAVGL